jgi:hypothetical protein
MRTSLVVAGSLSAGALAVALALPAGAAPGGAPAGTCTGTGPVAGSVMNGRVGDGSTAGPAYRGGTMSAAQHATGTGRGRATDDARGRGQGRTRGSGSGTSTTQAPSGTLTTAQRSALAAMVEEEKMAHDVYVTLSARFPDMTPLGRIATSESQHVSALRTLMTRYGVTDPTIGEAVGEFQSARMQSLYDSLVAGATTPEAALAAGVTIEQTDIADLTSTMAGVTAQDVLTVYGNLRTASQHHLVAFNR